MHKHMYVNVNVNANITLKNIIQIGRTVNEDVLYKNPKNKKENMCAKVIFAILLHGVVKMVDRQKVLLTIQLCAMKLQKQHYVF